MNLQDLPFWGQLLLITGVCAGLGFVFYQFVYSPEVENVISMETTLEDLNREIAEYRPFENRMDELEKEINQIQNDLKTLEEIFPSELDDIEVKRFIERIAEDYDIAIDTYTASAPTTEEHYRKRLVKYSTRGKAWDYMKFFRDLENRAQVVHVTDFKMKEASNSENEGGRYPIKTTFSISSFVYIPVDENNLVIEQ